ncbi:hypothetical protein BC826DRAFT_1111890 [Russula brevipes]|nr:hypothetical protein BC826DRAFT_1111890 [Russula brevipes]
MSPANPLGSAATTAPTILSSNALLPLVYCYGHPEMTLCALKSCASDPVSIRVARLLQLNQPKVVWVRASIRATIRVQQLVMVPSDNVLVADLLMNDMS